MSHLYTLLKGSVAFLQAEQIYVIIHLAPNPLQLNPGYAIVWDYLFLDRSGHKSNYTIIFRFS